MPHTTILEALTNASPTSSYLQRREIQRAPRFGSGTKSRESHCHLAKQDSFSPECSRTPPSLEKKKRSTDCNTNQGRGKISIQQVSYRPCILGYPILHVPVRLVLRRHG